MLLFFPYRISLPGVSTGVLNNASPEYDYINTTIVDRKTASNLEVEKAENDISFTSCSAYGTASNLKVEKTENETSFTLCSAYGIRDQPATMGDTNYDDIIN